jgi:hypothetical protein
VKGFAGKSIADKSNVQWGGLLWPIFQLEISSGGATRPERIVLASQKTVNYSPTALQTPGQHDILLEVTHLGHFPTLIS